MELHPIAVMFIGELVDCSKFTIRVPLVYMVLKMQLKSAGNMQLVLTKELGLNNPNSNSTPKAIAIISIAQPYVIRYSMALWALVAFKLMLNACMNTHNSFRKSNS